jgi:hypothetical protein
LLGPNDESSALPCRYATPLPGLHEPLLRD